jgi:hypothetical protein
VNNIKKVEVDARVQATTRKHELKQEVVSSGKRAQVKA